jgi:hypothetical protein
MKIIYSTHTSQNQIKAFQIIFISIIFKEEDEEKKMKKETMMTGKYKNHNL